MTGKDAEIARLQYQRDEAIRIQRATAKTCNDLSERLRKAEAARDAALKRAAEALREAAEVAERYGDVEIRDAINEKINEGNEVG